MRAADSDTPDNSMKRYTPHRRLLLIAAAVAGILFVFGTTTQVALAPTNEPQVLLPPNLVPNIFAPQSPSLIPIAP